VSGFSGFVAAAAQIGLQNVVIRPVRGIFTPTYAFQGVTAILPDIVAQATIEEKHTDRLEITEHPVEYGAAISDHAFKLPSEIVLTLGWSNSPADANLLAAAVGAASAVNSTIRTIAGVVGAGQAVQSLLTGAGVDQIRAAYSSLIQLQETRALFSLFTGKRNYQNMICRTIVAETDVETENSLVVTMECQQILLVNTSIVSLPSSAQKTPEETGGQVSKGKTQLVAQ